jgi:hypothetical protein
VTYGVSPITLSATGGGSGNAVTFSVLSGPGFVSGNTLTITGAGTVVVAANQKGNSTYAAAPQVTRNIVVGQALQSIHFTQPKGAVTFGVSPSALTATGGKSGNPVVFSIVSGPGRITGKTLSIIGAGIVKVTASQAGDANYLAAHPITYSITVAHAALIVAAINASVRFGQPIPALTYSVKGFVNKDTPSVLKGKPKEIVTATKGSKVGTYLIEISLGSLAAANYKFTFVDGRLAITSLGTAKAPSFSPKAGTYVAAQTVTLSDSTPGASIYYTINGANPTTASTRYTRAVTVKTNETIKAVAVAPGYTNSAIVTATYRIE